jgi:hypothetical protein
LHYELITCNAKVSIDDDVSLLWLAKYLKPRLNGFERAIMVYKDSVMVFIIGASGAGKTSVLHELERLCGDRLSCFYFDDIGVPSLDEMVERHGGGENWQKWATEQWIERMV